MRIRADVGHERIQPSLRDLRNREIEPGSKLPGYFQISLREAETPKYVQTPGAERQLSPWSLDIFGSCAARTEEGIRRASPGWEI